MSLFILGDVMNFVYIVKVEAIHGPLFVLRIMVLLEKMQTNYSVPCHKEYGGNTLATRYNGVEGRAPCCVEVCSYFVVE